MGSPGATIITDLTGLAVEVDDTEIDRSNLLPTAFFVFFITIFKVVKNNFKSFPKEQFMYIVRIYTIIMHLSFHEKMLQYQILL